MDYLYTINDEEKEFYKGLTLSELKFCQSLNDYKYDVDILTSIKGNSPMLYITLTLNENVVTSETINKLESIFKEVKNNLVSVQEIHMFQVNLNKYKMLCLAREDGVFQIYL